MRPLLLFQVANKPFSLEQREIFKDHVRTFRVLFKNSHVSQTMQNSCNLYVTNHLMQCFITKQVARSFINHQGLCPSVYPPSCSLDFLIGLVVCTFLKITSDINRGPLLNNDWQINFNYTFSLSCLQNKMF